MTEQRWATVADVWWERLSVIADLIPKGASVLDLGAGAQGLRQLVDGPYTPADAVQRSIDTLPLDLELGVYPQGAWDVVVAAGLLEYAKDPRAVLTAMRQLAPVGFVTYRPVPGDGYITKERIASGWLNHMTIRGLELMLDDVGFRFEKVASWKMHAIYRLT